MIKSQQQRNDNIFVDCVWWIIRERIKRDIDKQPESFRRITKSIGIKINKDKELQESLITAVIEDDRRNNVGYK